MQLFVHVSHAATLALSDSNHALLAARSALRGNGMSWVIIGAVAVFAIIGLWMLSRWWLGQGSPGTRNSPRALFTELCRVHGLKAGERQILLVLAETHQLVQPSDVFVDPTLFEEARVPPTLSGRKADVASLKRRLFAGLAPAVEESADEATAHDTSANVTSAEVASTEVASRKHETAAATPAQ
jgi:hypothetical protein